MALKCEHVVQDAPIAVSGAATTKLLEFFTALGITPAAAVKLYVFYGESETLDPRDGQLTAQVSRVQKTVITAGMVPLPGTFSIIDE